MGECQSAENIPAEAVNTFFFEAKAKTWFLQPPNFYNSVTRAVAERLGPFKFDEDAESDQVLKGPV